MSVITLKNTTIKKWLLISTIFLLAFLFVVVKPLSPNLGQIPGNLGDSRFNNYILEHNYRWVTGKEPSLLTAPFSFPHNLTLTFSDNHFGSMPIYSALRFLGLDRETAFQGWYLFSYLLNFGAAAYVLNKLNLNPIATGFGAFLFSFGLPVLARAGHAQSAYRFCVPLTCYALWRLSNKPKLKIIIMILFLIVWQFYIWIYMGYFLSLLVLSLLIVIAASENTAFSEKIKFWPNILRKSWLSCQKKYRIISLSMVLFLLIGLIALFLPYVIASNSYGFSRTWEEVSKMLPRVQSYFLADQSQIWASFSSLFTNIGEYRWEHQLFIGLPAILLIITGLVWRFVSPHRKMAFSFISSAGILILLTLYINGFSLYRILFILPGVHSIRAVTRIILALLWPFALFISIVIDAFIRYQKNKYIKILIITILFAFLFSESIFFNHLTYEKESAQLRISSLQQQIPTDLPENPILFVWDPDNVFWGLAELDAMFLAQDLGWPVLNGYSGNLPVGYGPTKDCDQALIRILRYMNFENVVNYDYFNHFLSQVVPIGPVACQWPDEIRNLSVTFQNGPLSDNIFSKISLNINDIEKREDYLFIKIQVENNSSETLPAESTTNNPFKLSWHFIDSNDNMPFSGFNNRKNIISDISPGDYSSMTIIASPPIEKGEYKIEISAVQENVAWFHDRGLLPPKSSQTIVVDSSGGWVIKE
jgi:hypothetical protein